MPFDVIVPILFLFLIKKVRHHNNRLNCFAVSNYDRLFIGASNAWRQSLANSINVLKFSHLNPHRMEWTTTTGLCYYVCWWTSTQWRQLYNCVWCVKTSFELFIFTWCSCETPNTRIFNLKYDKQRRILRRPLKESTKKPAMGLRLTDSGSGRHMPHTCRPSGARRRARTRRSRHASQPTATQPVN